MAFTKITTALLCFTWYLVIDETLSKKPGVLCWRERNADGTCSKFLRHFENAFQCCQNGGVAVTPYTSSALTFKYKFGLVPAPCDLCDGIHCKCPKGQACAKNKNLKCVCELKCSISSGELCATNGKTYANECELKEMRCKNEEEVINIAYKGSCKKFCKGVTCPDRKSCVIDQTGLSHCIVRKCPQSCEPGQRICGANGKTYESRCHLQKDACETHQQIAEHYVGPCKSDITCKDVKCLPNHACVTADSGKPICINCCNNHKSDLSLFKICGNNGKTYHHWCAMRKESCKTGKKIEIDFTGQSCKNK